MFPLVKRQLIRGYQAHIKAGLGGAADYEANYVPLYAPFNGKIETYWEKTGGNWTRLIGDNGDKIEMAHLSHYLVKSGKVSEGQLIAITGNSGSITTRPHKHIQIINKIAIFLLIALIGWLIPTKTASADSLVLDTHIKPAEIQAETKEPYGPVPQNLIPPQK